MKQLFKKKKSYQQVLCYWQDFFYVLFYQWDVL